MVALWYFGALAEKLGTGLQNLLDGSVTRTRLQAIDYIEYQCYIIGNGRVAELVYATDLKSVG